jgi:hypothetical protein
LFTGIAKHIKTFCLQILAITLFVALQGRAVTRYIEYFVARPATSTSPVKTAGRVKSIQARCKLQCFTQQFKRVSIEPFLDPALSIMLTGLQNPPDDTSPEKQQQLRTFSEVALRGPPVC